MLRRKIEIEQVAPNLASYEVRGYINDPAIGGWAGVILGEGAYAAQPWRMASNTAKRFLQDLNDTEARKLVLG